MKSILNKFSKKAVSVFLSFMIVISAIGGSITSFIVTATTASVTRVTNSDSLTSSPVTDVASAVKSVQYQYKETPTSTVGPEKQTAGVPNGVSSVLEALTNGTSAQSVEFAGNTFATGSGSSLTEYADGSVFFDIIYTLNSNTDISDIVVIGRNATWELSYKLYASKTRESLFDGEPIYTHTDKAGGQHYELQNVTAKYVAVRITAVTTAQNGSANSAWYNYYPRVYEFNVYGAPSSEPDAVEVSRVVNSNTPSTTLVTSVSSAVKSAQYQYKGKNDTVAGPPVKAPVCEQDTTIDPLDVLIDGKFDTTIGSYDSSFATGSGSTLTEYADGSVYFDIIYTLNSNTDISDIVVMGNTGVWKLSYKLYASKTRATLFDGDPIYTHDDKNGVQHYKVQNLTAKYVAMRVTSVTTNENATANTAAWAYIVRLSEFNVYGTPSITPDAVEVTRVVNSDSLTTSPVTGVSSAVKSVQYQFKKADASIADPENQTPEAPSGTNSVLEALTNGTGAQGIEFAGNNFASGSGENLTEYADGTVFFDIIYTLNSNTDISDIVVIGRKEPWELSYKIYASTKRETLFDGQPIFVHTDKATAQHYDIKGITAKYVALRITAVSTNQNASAHTAAWAYYPRLNEFNIYGTPSTKPDEKEISRVLNYDNASTVPSVEGGSIVTSAEYLSKAYGKEYTTPAELPYTVINNEVSREHTDILATLTDGNVTNAVDFSGGIFAFEEHNGDKTIVTPIYDGSVYYDVIYELDGLCKISDIVVAGSKTAWKLSYKLYVADNKYDLFKDEPIYVHNEKTQLQHYKLSGITARYVGMRITSVVTVESGHEASNGAWAYYPRIQEFNVSGTKVESKVLKPYLAETKEALTALSVVDKIKAYYYNGSTDVELEDLQLELLTDGEVQDEENLLVLDAEETPFAKWDGSGIEFYGDRALKIEYTLKGTANINDIFVHSNIQEKLITQEYKLYASTKYDDLYNTPIYDFSNPGKNAVQIYDLNLTAKYVALVITKPCTNDAAIDEAVPSLYEFNVHGFIGNDYDPTAAKYPDTSKMDLSTVESTYGKNMLKYENISYVRRDVKMTTSGNAEQDELIKGFLESGNDGKTHIDLPEFYVSDDKVTALIFKLSDYDFTKVKGFAFQGIASNNQAHYTSNFKVFVAEEKEDLFLKENLVFEYKADEETPIQRGVFYEIPKNEQPVGCYIAFQIVKPHYNAARDVYPRISYLWAWGEEAIIPVNPANLAENMPVDVYFAKGDKKTGVTDTNLTPEEVANLTDGNSNTSAKIDTDGKSRNTLEILYNLCSYTKIDKINVKTLINNSVGFNALKVYAADSIAEVYEDDSLVWTYKATASGNITATKNFKKSITARYFRFVFSGTKDSVQINEIEIIGMDNQKLKTRNLTASITTDDINITRTNLETKKEQMVSMNPVLSGGLIDSSKASAIRLQDGIVGEDKYDIYVYLGDLRTVSKINLNFFGKIHSRYNPKSVKVYVAETYEEIYDKKAKPTFTISEKEINTGSFTKLIRPTLARYVRLELEDFNKIEYLKNEDGTYPITAIISDLEMFGTKVNGLQKDEYNNVMLEFESKKNNTKLGILRLDSSDIYTEVVNIKVTKEKATNWQMKSLQNSSLAIVGKSVYKFELLDLYGNKVTDIGTRGIRISFRVPKGATASQLVLGNASKRTTIDAVDTNISDDGNEVYADFEWNTENDNKFTLMQMISSDDEYWGTIGELEDFKEGTEADLVGDHDVEWYDSIHTTDSIFTVTPITATFEDGLKFVASDISGEVSEDRCMPVLEMAGGKDIAIYYDMKLYMNGSEQSLDGNFVEITYNPPASVADNFTDLGVYHIDDYGMVTELWCDVNYEGALVFQTNSFSDFVIVGNRIDGDSYQVQLDSSLSPETGESATTLLGVIAFMIAAAFVGMQSIKSKQED